MKQRGFTLIEMMIVVAILGILASIIAPVINKINIDLGDNMLSASEIGALVFVMFVGIVSISALWRYKKIKEQKSASDAEFALKQADIKARIDRNNERNRQRDLLRKHPNYSHPQFNPKNPNVLLRSKSQTQTVGANSVGIQSNGDVRYTSSNSLTDDLLTAVILNHTLNSHSGAVSAKVDYETNSFTVTEEPQQKSTTSYSSTYSNDDDDRRSSYTSSYSSNASDSSYSSSSSDSSYSSSSSND